MYFPWTDIMSRALTEFFVKLRDLLLEGRFAEIADHFALPIVIYSSGRPYVLNDRQMLEQAMLLYWHERLEGMDPGISPRLQVEPRNSRDRIPVMVEWLFTDRTGVQVARGRMRCFLISTEDGPKIEMVEVLDMPDLPRGTSAGWHSIRH